MATSRPPLWTQFSKSSLTQFDCHVIYPFRRYSSMYIIVGEVWKHVHRRPRSSHTTFTTDDQTETEPIAAAVCSVGTCRRDRPHLFLRSSNVYPTPAVILLSTSFFLAFKYLQQDIWPLESSTGGGWTFWKGPAASGRTFGGLAVTSWDTPRFWPHLHIRLGYKHSLWIFCLFFGFVLIN